VGIGEKSSASFYGNYKERNHSGIVREISGLEGLTLSSLGQLEFLVGERK
jgi:hypothetical protein